MADATAQATDKAQEVAGQAKEKAQEAAGQAKGRVREQVDQRSSEAGKQVSTTAEDLRNVGDELRKQGKDTPAKLAQQAADRTERLGSYLTESDADRILNDVEDFARRQPWAVVAGGIALGFAASRLLKASSTQRYQQQRSGGRDPATPQLRRPPASNGHGIRTDREIGGPTAPPVPVGTATGGAAGTRPTGLDPH
ncbi:MAG: hypothetical protein QOH76_3597 [Thermoleophilaceae bacterium]|jgi:ElaB/YqjD/DUF883 family membrane-anchored ribosome-binding protein|nr:hypothetical protein [Thermoleophilaceae bacterium]